MDSDPHSTLPAGTTSPRRIAVVGAGRLGRALAVALQDAGIDVTGPLGRGATIAPEIDTVILAVPDAQIGPAAAALPADRPDLLAGHCSAATTLEPLARREAFSLHPLMTVTEDGAAFAGASAAIAGSTSRALATAQALAHALGIQPLSVEDEDRAAYHAAASIASNFLVTLEGVAERLAASAGIDREPLVALVRASVENWAASGAGAALTGPIARGDEQTVQRQRDAVAERVPQDLALFDVLTQATRRLAASDRRPHDRPTPHPARRRGRSRSEGRMKIVRSIAGLREQLDGPRRSGQRIGLVPTMGALHEGHLSLIRLARAGCDVVVVTLFVNPTQFDDAADLDAYPRDEERDAKLADEAGADVLFAPPAEAIYPPSFATTVRVAGITAPLEGESRGVAHFDGVATVVTKLFNIAQPDVAYFGQKDAQQVAVIRRLVRDLDIPVRIEVGPTVREPDGLALSSRNVRLRNGERERALALPRALRAAREAVGRGERDSAAIAERARAAMADVGVEPEYLALVAPDSFTAVDRVDGDDVLVAVAARVGDVRLIDNDLLTTAPANGHADTSTGRP